MSKQKLKALLIGWDAADWKIINPLIERGEMPVLAGFLEQGVMGDMTTLEPILSPMLWNSIATGKRANKHGILGFTEVDPQSGNVRPITSTSRKAKALWNILSQRGYRSNVVNWFGGHPAEPINGVVVSDAYARPMPRFNESWPIMPYTVHPADFAETLGALRIRPEQIKPETVLLFAPKAAELDQKRDGRLVVLIKLIAESLSVHAVTEHLLEHEPCDFMAVYYPSIDHFSHAFMRLHPPRRRGVDQKAFDVYQDVVNSAYRMHDLMLGALLALVDEETTVVLLSDHGFHSDHLRPRFIPPVPAGPAIEHRPLGIFAMRGPGIKCDERIYGANLLDIAPTILSMFGLAVGRDMDGRVLVEAFDHPPRIELIDSWETEPGESGVHVDNVMLPPSDSQALLEQFIALGYIDAPAADKEKAACDCRAEQDWNLARVFLDARRYFDALPLLERIHEELLDRPDIAVALSQTLLRVGLLDEAEAIILSLIKNTRETANGRWLLGEIAFQRRNYGESFEHLMAAKKSYPRLPHLHVQIGHTLLKLKSWADAEGAFRHAMKIDPCHATAHLGLAASLLPQRRNLEAAEAALTAVSYAHPLPLGHFYLGLALARMGQHSPAALALEAAVRLDPALTAAHRALARLYQRLGDLKKSDEHATQANRTNDDRLMRRVRFKSMRSAAAKLARARRARMAARLAANRTEMPLRKMRTDLPRRDADPERLTFVIISGLPRSGTSLMMQMLARGGLPIMTDGQRHADEDNPDGYYEWEAIKKLRQRPEILLEAKGKAIKVISALLPSLPRRHRYNIIFMERDIRDVITSQQKMIARRGLTPAETNVARMTQILEEHRRAVLQQLERAANVRLLKIDYSRLVQQPEQFLTAVVNFLGQTNLPRANEMAGAIRPELHRNMGSQRP